MAKPPQKTVRAQPPMKRSWLDGPPARVDGYAGDRLGLPQSGRGSVAGYGARFGALVIDLLVSGLISFLVIRPHHSHDVNRYNLVADGIFVVMTSVLLMLSGRTIGMQVLHLQVVRRDGRTMGFRSWPRQVLCALLIPAIVVDRDRRGLHDKLVNTVVVNTR